MLKDEILKKREKISVNKNILNEEIKRVKHIAETKVESIVKKKIKEINDMIINELTKEDKFILTNDEKFTYICGDDATWKANLFENVPKRIIKELNLLNKVEIKIDNNIYLQKEIFTYKFQCDFYDIIYTETYIHEADSSHNNVCIEGTLNKILFEEYLKNERLVVESCKEGLMIKLDD